MCSCTPLWPLAQWWTVAVLNNAQLLTHKCCSYTHLRPVVHLRIAVAFIYGPLFAVPTISGLLRVLQLYFTLQLHLCWLNKLLHVFEQQAEGGSVNSLYNAAPLVMTGRLHIGVWCPVAPVNGVHCGTLLHVRASCRFCANICVKKRRLGHHC